MKWPKVKGKEEPTADDLKSYKYFKDKASIEKEFGVEQTAGKYDNKHLWVRYDLPHKWNEKQQREYQIFCSGWLQYYDMIVRSNLVDHLIYFKWSSTSVSVFLSPPPIKKKKPQQPKLTVPGKAAPQELSATAPVATAENETVAGVDDQVDPPRVPPPPPPPES